MFLIPLKKQEQETKDSSPLCVLRKVVMQGSGWGAYSQQKGLGLYWTTGKLRHMCGPWQPSLRIMILWCPAYGVEDPQGGSDLLKVTPQILARAKQNTPLVCMHGNVFLWCSEVLLNLLRPTPLANLIEPRRNQHRGVRSTERRKPCAKFVPSSFRQELPAPWTSLFPGLTFVSPDGRPDFGNLLSPLSSIYYYYYHSHCPDEETETQGG